MHQINVREFYTYNDFRRDVKEEIARNARGNGSGAVPAHRCLRCGRRTVEFAAEALDDILTAPADVRATTFCMDCDVAWVITKTVWEPEENAHTNWTIFVQGYGLNGGTFAPLMSNPHSVCSG